MAARRTRGQARSRAAREFVSEVEEILDRMRSDLADLADARARGRLDADLANRLFRSAHSLKGIAGMFGFEGMSELAHHLEDVLDGLRMGRLAADAPALNLLDETVELVTGLVGGGDGDAAEAEAAVRAMIARIEAALEAPAPPAPPDELDGLDPQLLRALTEYEEHRLREALRRGCAIHLVEASFEILSFEEGLSELTRAVRDGGEVISTLPAPGDSADSQIRFSLLVGSDVAAEELRGRIDVAGATVRELRAGVRSAAATSAPQPPGPQPDAAATESEPPRAGEGNGELESLKSISDTVRVDIRKLDELMNLVGELVIQRGAIGAIAERLLRDPATAKIGRELGKVHKALERRLADLQAGVLEVRMVPLRQVFEKLSRVVRRLRRDSGKDVSLDIRGGDTELDKLIVEQLADPLMHVVRNAFDHAIEPAAERSAAGKPAVGTIRLDAFQRGNHVVIQVADDGRGIDADAVRARAVRLGLLAGDESLSRKQLLELVFAPGLSTSAEVTETSGRGVGMDVVRENVNALGGLVQLDSEPGRGTTVSFTLPITLAIIQALLVGVDDQRFAIPLNAVLETLLVDAPTIQRSEGREFLNLRGEPLPLRRLHAEFGLAAPATGARQAVVVVGLGDARVGVLVDRLEGQQDAVIKPIQGPIRNVRGIAGATELGQQGTVLVIDVAALVEDSGHRREAA
ncbi:MAG: chemotaxis protein CheA [Proteobacteria bacterium]|nr:MAG: chemotaxis protein CheA [Pseudomonadota bacterium]